MKGDRRGPVSYRGKLWLTVEQAYFLRLAVEDAIEASDDSGVRSQFAALHKKVSGMEAGIKAKAAHKVVEVVQ